MTSEHMGFTEEDVNDLAKYKSDPRRWPLSDERLAALQAKYENDRPFKVLVNCRIGMIKEGMDILFPNGSNE